MDAQNRTVDALAAIWQTRRVSPSDIVPGPKGTIAAPATHRQVNAAVDAAGTPPVPRSSGFELGGILGEGGNGVVRLAKQLDLRREVAVKMLRPAKRVDAEAAETLLREAWITGYLQHPNVVPVHALWEDGGSPVMALKRVDGASWQELLFGPQLHPEFGITDELEWHLKTLISVCHAVHYAHSRGVLHRDLKPGNVMVGRFGEVYVVDWGLAVRFDDPAPAWIPAAQEVSWIEGTPEYMAPEMAEGNGAALDPRTDVYLLGAVLHELVTYQPRHTGDTPLEVVRAAYLSRPAHYPDLVPVELAEICGTATHADPAQRYQTVDDLRRAVETFLSHRGVSLILDSAEVCLRQLETTNYGEDRAPEGGEWQRRIDEAQVTLAQAEALWPESARGRQLRQRFLRVAVEQALRRGAADQAQGYLAQMVGETTDLDRRLHALRARQAHEQHLAQIGRAMDINAGIRQRVWQAFAVGGAWFVGLMFFGVLFRRGVARQWMVAAACMFPVLGAATWAYQTRKRALLVGVARRQVAYYAATNLLFVFFYLYAEAIGVGYQQTVMLAGILVLMFVTSAAVLLELRAAWGVPILLVSLLLTLVWPQWVHELHAAGVLLFGALLGVLWVRQGSSGATTRDAPPRDRGSASRQSAAD